MQTKEKPSPKRREEDKEFYTQCSVECKEKYQEYYDAEKWKSNMKNKILLCTATLKDI